MPYHAVLCLHQTMGQHRRKFKNWKMHADYLRNPPKKEDYPGPGEVCA